MPLSNITNSENQAVNTSLSQRKASQV